MSEDLSLPGELRERRLMAAAVDGTYFSIIDNEVLNIYQFLFPVKVILLRYLVQFYKALGPDRGGLDVFDFEGRLGLFGVKLAECTLQYFRRIFASRFRPEIFIFGMTSRSYRSTRAASPAGLYAIFSRLFSTMPFFGKKVTKRELLLYSGISQEKQLQDRQFSHSWLK